MKLFASVTSILGLLTLSALAAPPSHSHFSGPAFRGSGGFARPFGLRSRGGSRIYITGRMYNPFWGGFCSMSPFGGPFYYSWYYCYPGYDWDYDAPYYWNSYDAPPAPPPPDGGSPLPSSQNVCGNWMWRADRSQYEWVTSACTAPASSQEH
jgi:hypothetical protein